MDIERLIALIVKTVVEELTRQGIIQSDISTTRVRFDKATTSVKPEKQDIYAVEHRVISEQIVLNASRAGHSVLEVPSNALITPLAEDTAKEKGLRIRRGK